MTHLCQCLTIASVDSTIVPSMSNNKPSNFTISGWAVKDGSDPPSGDMLAIQSAFVQTLSSSVPATGSFCSFKQPCWSIFRMMRSTYERHDQNTIIGSTIR